jgi:hypothetical protein
MGDETLRALERAAGAGDDEARERLEREWERRGVLAGLQEEVEAALARMKADVFAPTALDIARTLGEIVVSAEPGWRLHRAWPWPWERAQGGHALVTSDRGEATMTLGRADAGVLDNLGRSLEAEGAGPARARAALESLAGPGEVLRVSRMLAWAWSGWHRSSRASVDIQQVRLRPGMYVGDVHLGGLHHCMDELLDVPVALALNGLCRRAQVTLDVDGSITIDDDGPGISAARDERSGVPLLEAIFTRHGRLSYAEGVRYEVTGGMHGVGLCAVNALSGWLEVESRHEGRVHFQRYEKGLPLRPVELRGKTSEHGTRIRLLPDPTIFKPPVTVSGEWLAKRLRTLSYLSKGFALSFEDRRSRENGCFEAPRGLIEALEAAVPEAERLVAPVHAEGDEIELALTWTPRPGATVVSFVNGVETPLGGNHVRGLLEGIRGALTREVKRRRIRPRPDRGSYREGLVAFLSLRLAEPQFEGSTKDRLGNPEAIPAVRAVALGAMKRLIDERSEDAARALERVRRRARERPSGNTRVHVG